MTWLIIILAAGFVVLMLAGDKASSRAKNRFDPTLYTQRPLMTTSELKLYLRLRNALPNHLIFPQVEMSRVIKTPERARSIFNTINGKSFDFIVCTDDTLVAAAIELDDRTHKSPQRIAADLTKNAVAEAAGLKLFRWNITAMPDETEIRRLFAQ